MNFTIFIVDDEPPSLRSLKRRVIETELNFEICGEAYNGQEALLKIRALPFPPDVILTDIQMPVMDGLTLLQNMNEEYPNTQKIIVSGFKEFEYAKKALEMRACEYLLKPIQMEVLRELLAEIQCELEQNQYEQIKSELQAFLRHKQVMKMEEYPLLRHALDRNYHIIAMHIEHAFEGDIEYYGQPYWNADLIKTLLTDELREPLLFWVLESEKSNEFILVVSDRLPISQLEHAWQSLHQKASPHQVSITFAIQKNMHNLGFLTLYAQQLLSFLHHQIILGQPQTLYKENHTDGGPNHSLGINAVQKIKQYIQDHFYEPFDMKKLSLEHGISATYLSTIFKKTLNMSPMEYVINVRMEHAKKLIKQDSQLLIKDIAEMVGYMDNHYFSRVFKEYTGYNPSEYKQL